MGFKSPKALIQYPERSEGTNFNLLIVIQEIVSTREHFGLNNNDTIQDGVQHSLRLDTI